MHAWLLGRACHTSLADKPHEVLLRQVRQFYTAPTLVRALEAQDDKYVTDHDRSSLRVLGTVGEPINPRAWLWFFEESSSSLCWSPSPAAYAGLCLCPPV